MNDTKTNTDIIQDISLLYELALSIGHSLDLATNCERFLKTLMARKNLDFVSVWLRNEDASTGDQEDGMTLIYANPEFRIREERLPDQHSILRLLEKQKEFSIDSSKDRYAEFITEKDLPKGTFAIFALGNIGFLKLHSSIQQSPLGEIELRQLSSIVSKFSVSLEGCLAHQRVKWEAYERKRTEETLRASEQKFQQLAENINEAFWLSDIIKSEILYISPVYEKIWGRSCASLYETPRSFIDTVYTDDRDLVKGVVQEQLRGKSTDAKYRILRPDGAMRWVWERGFPIADESGEVTRVCGIFEDITDRKKTEETIQAIVEGTSAVTGKEFFRSLVHHLAASTGVCFVLISECTDKTQSTARTQALWYKGSFCDNVEYELHNGPCEKVVTGNVIYYEKDLLSVFSKAKEIVGFDVVSYLGVPLYDTKGNVLGCLSVADDKPMPEVSFEKTILKIFAARAGAELERKQFEDAEQQQKAFLRQVMDTAPNLIFVKDWNGRYMMVNKAAAEVYGTTVEKLTGKTDADFNSVQEEIEQYIHDDQMVMTSRQQKFIPEEKVTEVKTGKQRWFQTTKIPLIASNGKADHILGVATDITERKRIEEQIKVSLKEKEILLKEIHHRVKNNLQIISSLLYLQSSTIKDQKMLNMFKDSQNRVRSMALIHERLYQSKVLSKINFSEYIDNLTKHLYRSYGINMNLVRLKTDVDSIEIDVDSAVPCGLLLNELISNSLKHGFPNNREGSISIKLSKEKENHFFLTVKDDGIGLPKDLDVRKTQSLGLQLVNTLTRQLKGTMAWKNNGGTEFKFTFQY